MGELSADGVVEEFLERWSSSDLTDKMPEPKVAAAGRGMVEVFLIAVLTDNQRKGYAGRALEMLTSLCDENGITIMLTARRLDDAALSALAPDCTAGLSTEELVAWYCKRGFIETTIPADDTRTMERKPRARS